MINSIFNILRFNKRNWKAVVLCLFAATIFWFFNALNKNYSANINFPLAFDYDQERFIPVRSLPEHVRLNVNGLGWDLFRKSSGLKVPPLVIPLERPTDVRKIVGSTLPALFSPQLEGMQVNFALTDTLYVEMDDRIKRKIEIRVDSIQHYLNNEFVLVDKIKVQPDTVWLDGPKQVINQLPPIFQLTLPDKNISKNFNDEVEITFPRSGLVSRNPPIVTVVFEVEPLVEVTDTIQVEILNIPSRIKSSMGIAQVMCTYSLPARLANTVSADSLVAVVDLKAVPRGNHKIIPHVIGLPPQARLVKVDTVNIIF